MSLRDQVLLAWLNAPVETIAPGGSTGPRRRAAQLPRVD
jgi:hypothetical protein